jgi:hypothetical protein
MDSVSPHLKKLLYLYVFCSRFLKLDIGNTTAAVCLRQFWKPQHSLQFSVIYSVMSVVFLVQFCVAWAQLLPTAMRLTSHQSCLPKLRFSSYSSLFSFHVHTDCRIRVWVLHSRSSGVTNFSQGIALPTWCTDYIQRPYVLIGSLFTLNYKNM